MNHGVRSWCISIQKWVTSISCYRNLNNWSSTKECNGTVSSCCLDLSQSLLHYFPPVLSQYSSYSVSLGGGFQLSDRGILCSLTYTSSGFSYICCHTSPPIIIRNILVDKKNPCLTPEITGTRADGFPSCTIWQAKASEVEDRYWNTKSCNGIPHFTSSCRIKSFLQIHRNHRNKFIYLKWWLAEWVTVRILYHSCGLYILKLENVTPVCI